MEFNSAFKELNYCLFKSLRFELFEAVSIHVVTIPGLRQRDVRESVHHDIIMKITSKMQLCRLIYYSLSAVHVSGDVFAHHQEHLSVFTASGNIHQRCCRLTSRQRHW